MACWLWASGDHSGAILIHLLLHFLVPLVLVLIFWRKEWLQRWLLLLCAFVIDLDHLLADPIYDPERCSIGFHPLHSGYAFVVYAALLVSSVRWPDTLWWVRGKMVMYGVVVHLILDAADCIF